MQFGISTALLTPFGADGSIDLDRLVQHAVDVIRRGVVGVTLFGTTGEGASIGMGERAAVLSRFCDAVSPDQVVLGVAASSVQDATDQMRQGLAVGIRTFLTPPPFYFSPVGDEGLFDWHASLFENAPTEAQVILYNIPQVTGVGLSPGLTARLSAHFPDRILAIKDSSGNWETAQALLAEGPPVLIGDERLIHKAVPLGCAGSITGIANLHPERMCELFAGGVEDKALSRLVDRIVSGPVNPSLKVLLAQARQDPVWENLRPPLSPLDPSVRRDMLDTAALEPADG